MVYSPPSSETTGPKDVDTQSQAHANQSLSGQALADRALAGQATVLDVGGMKCAGCVRAVEQVLLDCDGVSTATVNLVTEMAAVTWQPDPAGNAQQGNAQQGNAQQGNGQRLAAALTAAGFPSQPRTQAEDLDGSPSSRSQQWEARKQSEQAEQLRQMMIAVGLLILSTVGHLKHIGWPSGWLNGSLEALTVPIVSTIWFHAGLATLALAIPGRPILVEGWRGVQRRAPNMNTLVALGTLSAYLASLVALLWPQLGWECFFDEPVMLVSFILLGRTLEQRARYRAANALRSLMALQPAQARLISNPEVAAAAQLTVDLPVAQVRRGDWLRVLPGEQVPVDGVITQGQTTVNESMLTGESMPVVKGVEDDVTAGTLNQTGAIALRVTRTGAETALARMIAMVETAQTRKAPIQRLADTISGYFTYGVLSLALLTFVFWYGVGLSLWPGVVPVALGHAHMGHTMTATATHLLVSLKLAIAVVVIACPCALGLATPAAILVGSGLGAERGVLIRGGDILEAVCQLDTLVFDKTGTLTTGNAEITDAIAYADDYSTDDLLQLAATVEQGTRHPLAVAIENAARDRNLVALPADHFETAAGFGIKAQVAGSRSSQTPSSQPSQTLSAQTLSAQTLSAQTLSAQTIIVGNLDWLTRHQITLPAMAQTQAEQWLSQGKTVIYLGAEDQFLGLLAAADTLRADAPATLAQLHQWGYQLYLLSGDHPATATPLAQQLGIPPTQVFAGMTPEAKVATLTQLQTHGSRVGFVGDGVNDAPALSQADVGIALHGGTDAAIETAGVVLMGDRLSDILSTIRLSRATVTKIRQNLGWAFTYNLIGIPLAAGVLLPSYGVMLSPALAGGLMAFSSVSVVLNSLLLRYQVNVEMPPPVHNPPQIHKP